MRITFLDSASKTAAFAAEELESYLKRMMEELPDDGWEIQLTAENGSRVSSDSRTAEYGSCAENDSYRVQIGKHGGRITGSNERSVLLAVYDYLHKLGCRFLIPKKEYEIIPVISKEQLSADYERCASFRHRGVCIEGADSLENILDYIDWLPKAGFNSFFLQFKTPYAFLARWYKHLNNPYVEASPYTPGDAKQDLALIEREAKKRGLLLHEAGHGWTGEVLGYQTLSWDVMGQKEQKEEDHPKRWMALTDGKRQLFRGIPANTNLCYNDKDALDAFAGLVVDYAKKNPQVDYIHVWLADDYNNLCECEECRRTTLSDQYVELLNEIDRRLTQDGIYTRIVFLLYQELLGFRNFARI